MPIVTKNTDLKSIDFLKGATLLVNKPYKWTSFDVVGKLRNLLRKKYNVRKIKVGHTGTLDPLATGLLLVCTGKHTKTIQSLQGLDKSYSATIKLGAKTDSFDKETPELDIKDVSHITQDDVLHTCETFLGDTEQIPPMFSAIKKNGTPLYKLAREGMTIPRDPRKITIHEMNVGPLRENLVDIDVTVSKGTYIRTLANDIGDKLGVGGYLFRLKRTSIGEYSSEDAFDMDFLVEHLSLVQQTQ